MPNTTGHTTNGGTPWTDGELTILKQMAGKYSAPQIAEKLGRGRDGVLKKIKRLGLPVYDQNSAPSARGIVKCVRSAKDARSKRKVSDNAPVVRRPAVTHVSYPPLEWCPTCHAPVSNWTDHEYRMGCKRPAA